jgi:hypothetical protein
MTLSIMELSIMPLYKRTYIIMTLKSMIHAEINNTQHDTTQDNYTTRYKEYRVSVR